MSVVVRLHDTDWTFTDHEFSTLEAARDWVVVNFELADLWKIAIRRDGLPMPEREFYDLILQRTFAKAS